MSDAAQLEFTGERVVPGHVDENLLNEHLARYRFAARFCEGLHVLDVGCGSGYGTAELKNAASVTAIDLAYDAVTFARETYGRPGLRFAQGSAAQLPFADGSFDRITAFEVIEHLDNWNDLLTEARRVLRPGGLLLVSTPNKAYYAEARKEAGPNPFHAHEFEYAEYESALRSVFPHVRIWTQNHADAQTFAPAAPSGASAEAPGDSNPEAANFYLAVCGDGPIPDNNVFVWVPASGNLLAERESHIRKLRQELAQKDEWLSDRIVTLSALQKEHEQTLAELRASNSWADDLNARVAKRDARIVELQDEVARSNQWAVSVRAELAQKDQRVAELQKELSAATEWAQKLNVELEGAATAIGKLQQDLDDRLTWVRSLEEQILEKDAAIVALQQDRDEKLAWARSLDEHNAFLTESVGAVQAELVRTKDELDRRLTQLRGVADSRWVKLGRALHVGPDVKGE